MIYRIAEHNNIYECGWIFITNGIFGKRSVVKKLAELRKHNNNVLEIVKIGVCDFKLLGITYPSHKKLSNK